MPAFDSKEVKKAKAPTMFIELVDQRDSGWILNGTERTANPVKITSPSAEFIPNRGFRLVKAKNIETGEDEWQNEPIRYIKNYTTLSMEEQAKKGIRPAKNKLEDMIIVKGGNFSVERSGAFIGLYDYLKQVFYNQSNPNRPASAKAIFKEVVLGALEEVVNERKVAIAEAHSFIGTLYVKRGKEYRYNEDKINSLCQIFLVYAETPAGKVNGLIAHAEKDPEGFLNKALKVSQTLEIHIAHALELGVIQFKGNTAQYKNKDKIIAALGQGSMNQAKKISKMADILGTDEYKSALDEFLIELEAEKEKQLK